MKKMLIVGNANSIFVKQYIENVLLRDGFQVILIQEGDINPDYMMFYKQHDVKLELFNEKSKVLGLSSILGSLKWAKKIKKRYGFFDFVHIHGLNRTRGMIGHWLRQSTGKLIISIWGSELLQSSRANRLENMLFYDEADCITVATQLVKAELEDQYSNRYCNKTRINRFGLSIFDFIDRIGIEESRESICQHFGIDDPKKIVILVGYNGRPRQRLIELTKVIQKLPTNLQDRVAVVYTLTYGVEEEYLRQLKKELLLLHSQIILLQDYMNEEETARLRCISDILLHAQPTDAFSASLQECLFAGGVVFNGSWLKYQELDQGGIKLIEFIDYEDLYIKLEQVLSNFSNYKKDTANNKFALSKLSSQDATRLEWMKIWRNE